MFRIVSLLVVLILAASPVSNAHGAAANRDTACAEDVATVINGDYPYMPWQITMLTGCAMTVEGVWVWPDDVSENLFQPMPLSGDREQLVTNLGVQIARLEAALDKTPCPEEGFATWGDFFHWLDADQRSALGLGVGNAATEWGAYGFARYEYADLMRGWLMELGAMDLMYFVQWWQQQRIGLVPFEVASIINLETRASVGEALDALQYVEDMGFWRMPWPWEMESVYVQAWFAYSQFPQG